MKRIVSLTATLGLLGATLVGGAVMAQTASASGYGCNGTLINSVPVKTPSGILAGYLYVYWDGANNCAVMVDPNENASYIDVELGVCAQTSGPGSACTPYGGPGPKYWPQDNGDYHWYAGPISVPSGNHCIVVGGEIALASDPSQPAMPPSPYDMSTALDC